MKPKISVVLPVYNGGKYIREAIDSILEQKCLDWELVVVDDCSQDGTPGILGEYADKDSRIKVIHNEINRKLPQSLNIGFSVASGEYLTWTSDDNRYLPDALEKMAEYLDENQDAAIVRSDFYLIDAQGKRAGESQTYSDENMYQWNCFGACFLYRRQVLDQVGEYDTDSFGVEDYDYWLRILSRYGSIRTIPDKLYEYRVHEGSLSATKRKMVIEGLAKLRERHQDEIFCKIGDKKEEICRMYYEMYAADTFCGAFRERFISAVPELEGDMGQACEEQFLIFGAGVYGERAAEILGERAEFFVDNDPAKVGRVKCGKKILSFGEAAKMADKYVTFIAIERKHIYEIIHQLEERGIRKYVTYQSYTHSFI